MHGLTHLSWRLEGDSVQITKAPPPLVFYPPVFCLVNLHYPAVFRVLTLSLSLTQISSRFPTAYSVAWILTLGHHRIHFFCLPPQGYSFSLPDVQSLKNCYFLRFIWLFNWSWALPGNAFKNPYSWNLSLANFSHLSRSGQIYTGWFILFCF